MTPTLRIDRLDGLAVALLLGCYLPGSFSNFWSKPRWPRCRQCFRPPGATWSAEAHIAGLGRYHLYGQQAAELLFTENDNNSERLWGLPNRTPWVKDAFHRRVIGGETGAVNPAQHGTKFAAWHTLTVAAGSHAELTLVLSDAPLATPFIDTDQVCAQREREADGYYRALLPDSDGDRAILRQALAGMIWNQQFYHHDVARWLDGDLHRPPAAHKRGRNRQWRHFHAADVMSVPDSWEFPWFAAWDLAFHALPLANHEMLPPIFRRLLNEEEFLSPNGVRSVSRIHAAQRDPHWRDLLLFNEYYHGDTGQGLGAAHQTGWTGLIANLLLMQR